MTTRLLITGICGFVGSSIAHSFAELGTDFKIVGIDNLIRPGSELNRPLLKKIGVEFHHGDIRNGSDLETIGPVDWVIDAAANPSVLAGIDGKTSSRQLVEHNLGGTINLLEYCKKHSSGLILLSTSRVYSIQALSKIEVEIHEHAYSPKLPIKAFPGFSLNGIAESFSTSAPISLYGATKLTSEILALEYSDSFEFPCWINRCGVLAGGGQFGRSDQGIFAYWLHSHKAKRPLKYIGFDGNGYQVRDCLHPRDLVSLLTKQIFEPKTSKPRISNVSGGIESARSLHQLTTWCDSRFGSHKVTTCPEVRPYDLPWVVLDSSQAEKVWNWQPKTPTEEILDEIALHAENNPNWLKMSE